MYSVLRSCLIGLLIFLLVEVPVAGAPAHPLGVMVQTDHARLGASEATAGATVFAGDRLTTELNGSARVRAGRAQLYLPADAAATLGGMPGGISVALQRGTIFFSSSGNEGVEIRVSDALIRTRNGQPSYAKVTLVGPNEFEVASYLGMVDVTAGDETRAVMEKTGYRVLLERDQAQAGTAPAGRSRAKFIAFLLFAAAAGAAIGIALTVFGGGAPTPTPVSPARP